LKRKEQPGLGDCWPVRRRRDSGLEKKKISATVGQQLTVPGEEEEEEEEEEEGEEDEEKEEEEEEEEEECHAGRCSRCPA